MIKINQFGMYFEYAQTLFLNKIFKYIQNPIAEIFVIHRVENKKSRNIPAYEDLIISPKFLEKLICEYLDRDYSFISMDDLNELLNKNLDFSLKKNIVITIDDGYKDIYTNAYPILKKYNIPFIFYVASSFPDKNIPLWWNYLNDLIISNSKIKLKNGNILNCETMIEKQDIYICLSKKILKMGNQLETKFPLLFDIQLDEIIKRYKHLLINWEDVRLMSKDTLCTVGAHTMTHLGLKYCDKKFVYNDLVYNKKQLEDLTNKPIEHLAYPYGTHYSVGKREYSIAKKLGFKTATSMFSSKIYRYHKNNKFSLPRIILTEK